MTSFSISMHSNYNVRKKQTPQSLDFVSKNLAKLTVLYIYLLFSQCYIFNMLMCAFSSMLLEYTESHLEVNKCCFVYC